MSKQHKLFLECYTEVRRSFSGSTPHIMEAMANRLCNSVQFMEVEPGISGKEYSKRCRDLGVALQTVDNWPGLKRGEMGINHEGRQGKQDKQDG